jgi:hypothetical protein
MAGEIDQPNELLGIRLKPTLQLGSKGLDDSKGHSRAYTAAGASLFRERTSFPGITDTFVFSARPIRVVRRSPPRHAAAASRTHAVSRGPSFLSAT